MLLLLIAAATGGTDWVTPILTAGGPFAVVFVWFTWAVTNDKLGNNSERNALREEKQVLLADLREVRKAMTTDVIPLVVKTNELMERALRVIERRDT